jgi:hypothetical protein
MNHCVMKISSYLLVKKYKTFNKIILALSNNVVIII